MLLSTLIPAASQGLCVLSAICYQLQIKGNQRSKRKQGHEKQHFSNLQVVLLTGKLRLSTVTLKTCTCSRKDVDLVYLCINYWEQISCCPLERLTLISNIRGKIPAWFSLRISLNIKASIIMMSSNCKSHNVLGYQCKS